MASERLKECWRVVEMARMAGRKSPQLLIFCAALGWAIGVMNAVCAEPARADFEWSVVDPAGAPVRDAVLALFPLDSPPTPIPASPRAAVMDQIDLAFEPHVLAVETGTTVDFPNSDQVRHSIYSFSAGNAFEVKLYRGLDAPPVTFREPGLVVLGCHIHDSMLAFIYVLDTPYSSISDHEGRGVIAGAPTGRFRFEVRHPRADKNLVSTGEIRLPQAGRFEIRLEERPAPRPEPSPERVDPLQSLFDSVSR